MSPLKQGTLDRIVIVRVRTWACLSNKIDSVVSYCSRRLAAEVAGSKHKVDVAISLQNICLSMAASFLY